MRFNLGMSTVRARFGRFSYIEKSEYWALVWGTMIMGATGVILWFDNTFIGLLTKLGWDVARTIHYYEAWLATLAIIVWHLYFVIFNPDVYPMNVAWWKGTLTEREMHEEHPLELERLKENDAARANAEHDDPDDRSA
jgi:cytochrome b subunit of formate dehydrogenase